jgi:Protein of unknown function (DUF2950)
LGKQERRNGKPRGAIPGEGQWRRLWNVGGGEDAEPYHGYFYRTLTAQGAAAKGGAKSYLTDGKLTGGVALVAYPAQYKVSGVMTFIINQNGVVYQKDLGEKTSELAGAITEYNPDGTWKRVTD